MVCGGTEGYCWVALDWREREGRGAEGGRERRGEREKQERERGGVDVGRERKKGNKTEEIHVDWKEYGRKLMQCGWPVCRGCPLPRSP